MNCRPPLNRVLSSDSAQVPVRRSGEEAGRCLPASQDRRPSGEGELVRSSPHNRSCGGLQTGRRRGKKSGKCSNVVTEATKYLPQVW